MTETIQANWLAFALALLIGLAIAWWLFGRAATPPRREHRADVLDEGQAPAQRNQALIDAPPAAQIPPIVPPPMAGTLGGIGEIVAVAAQDEVEAVEPEVVEEAPAPPAPEPVAEIPPPAPEPVVEAPPPPVPEPIAETPAVAAEPEPVVEAPPPPAPELVAEAPPPPASEPASVSTAGDDLSRIKGLGPKLQALLLELGITTYARIAGMTEADLADLDPQLGPFAGRPARDNWVEQARLLASGDTAAYEAKFGKL